jgi:hypothetical protein
MGGNVFVGLKWEGNVYYLFCRFELIGLLKIPLDQSLNKI